MRVLHLFDAPHGVCPATLALLADGLDRTESQQRVLLLGGEALRRAAMGVGLEQPRVLGVILGCAALSFHRLRAWRSEADLLHCWSPGALTAARLALPQIPRLLTLTASPGAATRRWLRVLTSGDPTVILTTSATIRRDLLGAGVHEGSVHVLRPAIDMARFEAAARPGLRRRWKAEDPRVRVIALLGDPPQRCDAWPAMMAMGLCAEALASREGSAPLPRLLLHPSARHRRAVQDAMTHLGQGQRIIVDEAVERPWEVLPGCDAAVLLPPHGLSMLYAMAAGVPLLAEATYATSEVLEDRHSALLCKPDQPRAMAHRLTQLLSDTQLAWKVRDAARTEAYSFFSRQRYRRDLRGVYEQLLAGAPITIAPLEPTAGLRFAGRA